MDQTSPLTDIQKRVLTTIFERAAEGASQALSIWLARPVRMAISGIDDIDLTEASGLLGPPEGLVAACGMGLTGRLSGEVLLIFEDRAGLALADLLLRQPLGSAVEWGEIERSAAAETTNIVGCALLNSLAAHLPSLVDSTEDVEPLVPGPPVFRHEFAGSLLEFALMDQAVQSDRVLLARSEFTAGGQALSWSLLFVPGAETLRSLATALDGPHHDQGGRREEKP